MKLRNGEKRNSTLGVSVLDGRVRPRLAQAMRLRSGGDVRERRSNGGEDLRESVLRKIEEEEDGTRN